MHEFYLEFFCQAEGEFLLLASPAPNPRLDFAARWSEELNTRHKSSTRTFRLILYVLYSSLSVNNKDKLDMIFMMCSKMAGQLVCEAWQSSVQHIMGAWVLPPGLIKLCRISVFRGNHTSPLLIVILQIPCKFRNNELLLSEDWLTLCWICHFAAVSLLVLSCSSFCSPVRAAFREEQQQQRKDAGKVTELKEPRSNMSRWEWCWSIVCKPCQAIERILASGFSRISSVIDLPLQHFHLPGERNGFQD